MPLPEVGSCSSSAMSSSPSPSSSSSSASSPSSSSCAAAELWRFQARDRPCVAASSLVKEGQLRKQQQRQFGASGAAAAVEESRQTAARAMLQHRMNRATATAAAAAKGGDAESKVGFDGGMMGVKVGSGGEGGGTVGGGGGCDAVGVGEGMVGGEDEGMVDEGKVECKVGRAAEGKLGVGGRAAVAALSVHAAAGAMATGGKVGKRRSRASNKPPITVLSADTSNFRAMVQKLTGIPASAAAPPFLLSSLNNAHNNHNSKAFHQQLWGSPAPPLPLPLLLKPHPSRLPPVLPPLPHTLDTSSSFLSPPPFPLPRQQPFPHPSTSSSPFPGLNQPFSNGNFTHGPHSTTLSALRSLLVPNSNNLGTSSSSSLSSSSSSPSPSIPCSYSSSSLSSSSSASLPNLWEPAEDDRWRGNTTINNNTISNSYLLDKLKAMDDHPKQASLPCGGDDAIDRIGSMSSIDSISRLDPTITGTDPIHASDHPDSLRHQTMNLESILMEDDRLDSEFFPSRTYHSDPWNSFEGSLNSSLAPKLEIARLT